MCSILYFLCYLSAQTEQFFLNHANTTAPHFFGLYAPRPTLALRVNSEHSHHRATFLRQHVSANANASQLFAHCTKVLKRCCARCGRDLGGGRRVDGHGVGRYFIVDI